MISVLLNVAPDGGQESRLQAALALVNAHGGHITCVHTVGVLPVAPDPTTATTEAEAIVGLEEVAYEFQKTVEAGLDGAGVDWTWLRFYGDPATILIERSRFADVIVMSADGSFPPISSVPLHTRTPVLAVRQQNPNFTPEGPALVAWNGSIPAANAVHGAMPMFQAMQPVHVLAVDDDSRELPASLVQEYLVEHDIESEIHWRPSNGQPVADAILECAEKIGTGMIVAGAFGHNRLREMLLGSATRDLLEKSSRPLLLSH
jgi:nucleotide-binding universal stress UspA family protein